MLVDEDVNIREKAVQLIVKLRKVVQNGIRKFNNPKLNRDAQIYYEMVDLDHTDDVFEPPILIGIPNDKILECVDTPANFVSGMIKGIPNHTQAVERTIQSISQASHTVFGQENRHARVCATIDSRKKLPKAVTKNDYSNYCNKN